MHQIIRRLGLDVVQQWRATGRDPQAFSPVAERALLAVIAKLVASPSDWVRTIAAWPDLPKQRLSSKFGEPPVTLFARAGVRVEVYFWLHPVTAVHDHGFSGAFGVLHGVTLHSTSTFESPDAPTAAVRVGQLREHVTELLFTGEVRRIAGVQRLIHRVAHLSRPSVSVCVRTANDVDAPQQRTYFAPNLAVVGEQLLVPAQRRQVEMLALLAHTQQADIAAVAVHLLDSADDLLAFWLLKNLAQLGDMALVLQVTMLCRPRPWLDALLPALFQSHHDAAQHQVHCDVAAADLGETARIDRLLEVLAPGPQAERLKAEYRRRA